MENNINNLKNKTDEELQDIMRESIDNSYVPSSIYNKAKQELSFRDNKRKNSKSKINIIDNKVSGNGTLIKFENSNNQEWYKKPIGLILIIVVGGLILAYFTNWFGLN